MDDDRATRIARTVALTALFDAALRADGKSLSSEYFEAIPGFELHPEKCVHALESVGPYFVPLWDLKHAYCGSCNAEVLRQRIVDDPDHCDACGVFREAMLTVNHGEYLLVGNICPDCFVDHRRMLGVS
jgi:hypothetical protein